MESKVLDVKRVKFSYNRKLGEHTIPTKASISNKEGFIIIKWTFDCNLLVEDFTAFAEEVMKDFDIDDSEFTGAVGLSRLQNMNFVHGNKMVALDFERKSVTLINFENPESFFKEAIKTFCELSEII